MCNDVELSMMRRKVAERLEGVELGGGDSHANLSAICRAVYEPDFGWTYGACNALRSKLVMLMGAGAHVGAGKPITGWLRGEMATDGMHDDLLVVSREKFDDLCGAIDSVHASLEAENESLRAELRGLGAPRSKRDVLADFATRWGAIVGDWDGEERRALLDEYEELLELAEVDA